MITCYTISTHTHTLYNTNVLQVHNNSTKYKYYKLAGLPSLRIVFVVPSVQQLWNELWSQTYGAFRWWCLSNKKAQLSLTNPRDAKACQNCSNSTCLQRCRWQYWLIFMRLTAVASEIREIQRNSLKIQTYRVQGHPRSSIFVPIESPYVTCY